MTKKRVTLYRPGSTLVSSNLLKQKPIQNHSEHTTQ